MKRVAYLNCRTYRGNAIPPDDVPPLERVSHKLVFEAGEQAGISFALRYWDDPKLRDEKFDAALIRTTWDYHERPDVFIDTLSGLEQAGTPVFNSSAIARWNARKTYLRELGDAAIETLWADAIDPDVVSRAFETLGADDIVVKPQVGAGSRETVRLQRDAWRPDDLKAGPRGAAMIQPFLRAISEGEWSLFWFGGLYSHAIRKTPAEGTWYANIPATTRFEAAQPSREALDVADEARQRAPKDLLYARIDLVRGNDGNWRVIEIEAIEPYLFLDFAPEGAARLVGALSKVLAG